MSGSDRKIRYTRALAVLFVIAGFAAIAGGWYGMIRQDQSVDKQFPYLISGGAAGVALLLFGVGLLVIAQIRTERRRLSTTLERVAPPLPVGMAPPASAAIEQAVPGRYWRMFGMALCAAGFASIALGWNGAARLTVVDQQFPFLMSGGVLGVALVLLGVGVLLVSQIRTERQKLARLLERLAGAMGRPSVETLAVAADGGASRNGLVLAGPSTYHRFDCALISGRPGLDRVTVEVARARGLSECRVCRPLSREEPAEDAVGDAAGRKAAQPKVSASDESIPASAPDGEISAEPDGGKDTAAASSGEGTTEPGADGEFAAAVESDDEGAPEPAREAEAESISARPGE